MRGYWLDGCIHYGNKFDRREEKEDGGIFPYSPLYMRMRRHFHFRRGWPYY
jgi:hypothetical protein